MLQPLRSDLTSLVSFCFGKHPDVFDDSDSLHAELDVLKHSLCVHCQVMVFKYTPVSVSKAVLKLEECILRLSCKGLCHWSCASSQRTLCRGKKLREVV